MEELPDCMKVCFKALYDITNEFAFKTYIKHGWNPKSTLVKSVTSHGNSKHDWYMKKEDKIYYAQLIVCFACCSGKDSSMHSWKKQNGLLQGIYQRLRST